MQLKAMYILNKFVEKFVTKFYKKNTQGHNRAIALVTRLKQKYIVKDIWKLAKKITRECLNY